AHAIAIAITRILIATSRRVARPPPAEDCQDNDARTRRRRLPYRPRDRAGRATRSDEARPLVRADCFASDRATRTTLSPRSRGRCSPWRPLPCRGRPRRRARRPERPPLAQPPNESTARATEQGSRGPPGSAEVGSRARSASWSARGLASLTLR